jgi:ankyrin repeat protein
LHLAVSGGHVDCVRFLFGAGAQMVADSAGHTPLQQAIKEGRQDLAMEINALLCEQVELLFSIFFYYWFVSLSSKSAESMRCTLSRSTTSMART